MSDTSKGHLTRTPAIVSCTHLDCNSQRMYLKGHLYTETQDILISIQCLSAGRHSSVGTAKGWTVGRSNPSGGGEIFRNCPHLLWGNSYTTGTWSFPGVKRPRRGLDHPPTSRAEVKERVDIHLHALWAFEACARVNFTVIMRKFWRLLKITELMG